jgi:hypothetical protein
MSDVVAIALITGLSTAGVAIVTGALALWRERIRSGGERQRFQDELLVDERRMRAEAVREGRLSAVGLLQKWVEQQVALAADLSVLIATWPVSPVDISKLVDDRLRVILSIPPEEASVNAILSHFSDVNIIEEVRRIEDIQNEIRNKLYSPEFQLAASNRELAELARLWEPISEGHKELDHEIAALNSLLEKYVIGVDLA